jgi:hypothetical protein
VLFWYTAGLDDLQHRHGTQSSEAHAHLTWIGAQVEGAAGAARGAGREPWIYLLSDHGMTDVTRVADAMGAAEAALAEAAGPAGLTAGRDWLAFYDSTLARFWWRSEGARSRLRPAVRARLAELGAGRWLTAEDERELHVHFADRRYGDDLFLAEPGVLFAPSYMGSARLAAMHGYHPSEPTARAVLLSSRPLGPGLGHVVDVAGHLERESRERDA